MNSWKSWPRVEAPKGARFMLGVPPFLILIGLSECHSRLYAVLEYKGEEAPKRADVVGWSSSQTCIFVSGFFKSASFVRTIHFSPVTKSNCQVRTPSL